MHNRRDFLKLAAVSASLPLLGCQQLPVKQNSPHVVIVGGGFAGATAAKYIRLLDASIKVTLIEPKSRYITCPGSNWVLGGLRELRSLTFSYQRLINNYGIKLIHDHVTSIDAETKQVRLAGGESLRYERLIVAPGISFRWDTIEGYDAATAEYIPHAWQAGSQTETLLQQVRTMPENGKIVISAPANPFRCPPGPYERASMLAHYCKKYKPKAKILIVDHKRGFSKQGLFELGWKRHYGFGTANSLIEWQSIADNPVIALAAKRKTLHTDFGDKISADVLNFIPPQQAGLIARQSGLTDASGWCPVNPLSCESTLQPSIHVIGDAAIQQPIPKSAFAANSEAKVCALAIINLLNERAPEEPVWVNTCYSLLTPDQAVSIAMVYKRNAAGLIEAVPGAGGVSQYTDRESLRLESLYALNWYDSITADSFA
jgi:sulfide dehydrogenase [flavocytochrome c] flavoprotein chain